MSLLSASGLAFRHAAAPNDLFSDLDFDLNPGDRVALVGPNGAGKSTLLGLLSGDLQPAAGHISCAPGLRLTGMAQVSGEPAERSLFESVLTADPLLGELRATMTALAPRLDDPATAAAWADALEGYQAADGYAFEAKAERVLAGLGLPAATHATAWGNLSSGQRARAMLARLLLTTADVWLLDEPTNHLDAAGRLWLEGWLPRQPVAVVLVSHDRAFLAAMARTVWELRGGELQRYAGGYAFFGEQKAIAERQAWAAYEGQRRRHEAASRTAESRLERAQQMAVSPEHAGSGLGDKAFYRRKAAKVERTAKVILARANREPEAPKPRVEDAIPAFDWGWLPRPGDGVLAVRGLGHHYRPGPAPEHDIPAAEPPVWLFRELSLDLARGDRLAIVGPNGCGKSTLLRIVAGQLAPRAGTITLGHGVRLGVFGQEAEQLDPAASALDNLLAVSPDPPQARLLLACLRLRGERVFQPVATMSAGERAKVALARLLLAGVNLLLLDEPTNHLDLDTREAIEATLASYPGAMLLVSHDDHFVAALTEQVLRLDSHPIDT